MEQPGTLFRGGRPGLVGEHRQLGVELGTASLVIVGADSTAGAGEVQVTYDAEGVATGDLNGSGQDELIVDWGPWGIYILDDLTPLRSLTQEILESAAVDTVPPVWVTEFGWAAGGAGAGAGAGAVDW